MIEFINPNSGNTIIERDGILIDSKTNSKIGILINGIPRFVKDHENYASNFGYQWKKWHSILSDSRNSNLNYQKFKTIQKRTKFDKLETTGKTILECGCGGGDDTEVLLKFNFSEIHAFDLSTSVERAFDNIKDSRVVFSQASIFDIPYEDYSFDFVFCHRVLQHTPDPERALRSICKKVKKGGVLFVHSYHSCPKYLTNYKYKYRILSKRLPVNWIDWYLNKFGKFLHKVNTMLYSIRLTRKFAYAFIPMEYSKGFANFTKKEIIELEKLVTFDALTPKFDIPMK